MSVKRFRRPRRPGIAPTVGLIVEGDSEFIALPLLYRKGLVAGCPPLRAKNLGGVGSDRHPTAIAEMVAPKVIAYKQAGVRKVVVCFDREQRLESAGQFAQTVAVALAGRLVAKGQDSTDVHVVIADRTFEAWLLADALGLHRRGIFEIPPRFFCFEGSEGEQSKKGVIELEKLLGRAYVKTKHGPEVFEKMDFSAARLHGAGQRGSKSIDKFLRVLGV